MPLGQLHGRTRTGPKALNAAAHLMRTFLISLTDLLEEWLKLSIYMTNWHSQSLWYSENGIAHAQIAFLYIIFFDNTASHVII